MIALEAARQVSGVSRDILGVHFRGTDMRTAPYHPMPPSTKQIFSSVDSVLEASSFRELFVVSEHEDYVAKFVKRYGSSKVATLDVARSSRKAGDMYKTHPRLNHRYILGLEALIETYLLAECGGLVSGFSGVSEMANVLSNGEYVVSKKNMERSSAGQPDKGAYRLEHPEQVAKITWRLLYLIWVRCVLCLFIESLSGILWEFRNLLRKALPKKVCESRGRGQ